MFLLPEGSEGAGGKFEAILSPRLPTKLRARRVLETGVGSREALKPGGLIAPDLERPRATGQPDRRPVAGSRVLFVFSILQRSSIAKLERSHPISQGLAASTGVRWHLDPAARLELPRFGGQFTAFAHTTGCGLVVEPRRGSISPSVPRKRGVPSSSSAEFEAA